MEKSGIKSKNRLLKLVASSAVSFQNPPFSPNREKAQARKGFSGQMIPPEARYKSKNSSYITHEPTSPKVSCMGQIKHKKKIRDLNKKKANVHDSLPPRDVDRFISHSTPLEQVNPSKNQKPKIFKSFHSFTEVKKKNPAPVLNSVQSLKCEDTDKKKKKRSGIRNIFGKARKRNDYEAPLTAPSDKKAPSLGQLQRFSSGRNSLSNFDWTKSQISPEHDDESEGEWDEEDAKISFSAPLSLSRCSVAPNVEPRKEINLWKRRTMPQPKPLQLNT